MKVPAEIKAYCKHCNAYTVHKVKMPSKGKPRSLAIGNRKHERKLKGHGGKRAGKVPVKKQGKKQVVVLICSQCGKKQLRTIGTRTKKKVEIKR